jgi:hypothetical protein
MPSDTQLAAFAAFALASQAILLLFFAGRRWRLAAAERYGWIAYAFGALGAALGIWLFFAGASWRLFAGPLLYAVWAAFGAWADLVRRNEWRWQPIRWSIFGPYLVLYLAAQMFLWWPLWNTWRTGWVTYLVFFIANTALNMSTHFGPRPTPTRHPASEAGSARPDGSE